MCSGNFARCVEVFLAVILPPLGVFFRKGCKLEFWICLVLTCLGYIPGILYAIWVIVKHDEEHGHHHGTRGLDEPLNPEV